MSDSIEQVIYAEAQRGLALQPVLLNELRSRTGIVLTLSTAVTSFLGALAIDKGGLHGWGGIAIAAYLVAVGCCLAVLRPREWTFYENPAMSIQTYLDSGPAWTWTTDRVRRDLALHMEDHADAAQQQMTSMQKLLIGAGTALAIEVACWLVEYGT